MQSFYIVHFLCRADDGGAVLRRNLSTAFMRGLGRASVMPLRAARSISRKRHRPELPFMPGRGADIGPENEASFPTRKMLACLTVHLQLPMLCTCRHGMMCPTSTAWLLAGG